MTVSITNKAYTYNNGNANDADQVEADLNAFDGNFTNLKTKVDNLLSGAIEDAATLTLNSTFAGTPSSNGRFILERGTSANVEIRWNETSDIWQFTSDGTLFNPLLPKNYINGLKVAYASAGGITIKTGSCADSTNAHVLDVTANKSVSLATSGANGLDTGAEANSTWYYVYVIGKTDGTTAGLLSTVNESVSSTVTLPSGYVYKRQLPIAIRNNASGNLIPFFVINWASQPTIHYNVGFGTSGGIDTNNVLNAGTQTSYTDVDLSSLVPPISTTALLKLQILYTATSRIMYVRTNGNSDDGEQLQASADVFTTYLEPYVQTDASQIVEYKMSGAGASGYIWVKGYVVDQF